MTLARHDSAIGENSMALKLANVGVHERNDTQNSRNSNKRQHDRCLKI